MWRIYWWDRLRTDPSFPGTYLMRLSGCVTFAQSWVGKLQTKPRNKKRQRSGVRPSRAGGGALQMLQRSSEADNVLPRLPQGTRLQRSVLIWVSSKPVLQGSAVLAVVLLSSAVSHLLVTRLVALTQSQQTWCTPLYLPYSDSHICKFIDTAVIVWNTFA